MISAYVLHPFDSHCLDLSEFRVEVTEAILSLSSELGEFGVAREEGIPKSIDWK